MNYAIILSGGVGSRMGINIPKQYVRVVGKPVLSYCLQTFADSDSIDAIIIGVADEWTDFVRSEVDKLQIAKPVYYATPGETRQYSIYNALKVIRKLGFTDKDFVIVHDAARPLVSKELINACLDGCNEYDGVMPVIPAKDTIYYSIDGHKIDSLLDRNTLWCGQAPEAFNLAKYLGVHDSMSHEDLLRINGSTEIAFKSGLNCTMISGDPMNFKITTPEDLSNFEALIANEQ
jgi:2-C-methyl-D-erythritol 4-phosphate cytidylyltransferase